ncbi:MAG: HesA/MoeB/ThiF family protein [Gammaproteobacteria bacterium]|nr:HesA/MoeB/ThiF family protein [Gammaproteobacteria bacterium]
MNERQRYRYSRQIRLPKVGEQGQERLLASRALIIGMGGLGCPVSMYLAAAGVGHLVISDYDRVDESNLQRQIAHAARDIGELKATSAKSTLLALNPEVRVDAVDWELDDQELNQQVRLANVVVDCTDNFPTRFAVNRACIQTATPLVIGSAIRLEGQLMTYLPEVSDSPCYRCLYRDEEITAATCSEEGVLAPVVGVIGSLQAVAAIKVLLGQADTLSGQVLLFDADRVECQSMRLPKNPDCPDCGAG